MSKTILLGTGGAHRFDVKVQKWNYIFIGVLFLAQAVLYYFKESDKLMDGIMMRLMLFSGFYALIFALINFTRTSKFAPKVVVSKNNVIFKPGILKKSKTLKWQDIQSLRFKPFRIDFKTTDTIEVFSYETTSDISIDLKEALREMAEQKNIEVLGG